MAGVMFIITIPTEQEEKKLNKEVESKPETSSKSDNTTQPSDKCQNGVFKIVGFMFVIFLSNELIFLTTKKKVK